MLRPVFVYFEVVSSTNDVGLELAKTGAAEGTVVVAHSQYAGRGRRGRVWLDEPGSSVLMSAILRPRLPSERLHELSFVASLAVAESLREQFGLQCALKWPNDVLVGSRKICGILVETTGASSEAAAVVGIGVNVNQTEFPSEIAEEATSIALETGSRQDVRAAAEKMGIALLNWYDAYRLRGFKEILDRWRTYMCGVGTRAEMMVSKKRIVGEILGVDEHGRLNLLDNAGRIHSIPWADYFSFRPL